MINLFWRDYGKSHHKEKMKLLMKKLQSPEIEPTMRCHKKKKEGKNWSTDINSSVLSHFTPRSNLQKKTKGLKEMRKSDVSTWLFGHT